MPEQHTARIFYAIGDIHGEAGLLADLHEQIIAHHHAFHDERGGVIVHLGDYIDRGENAYLAIERVRQAERDAAETDQWLVRSLLGNHEKMLLNAQTDERARATWYNNGGDETEASYLSHGFATPPPDHLEWIKTLPNVLWFQAEGLVFVHAGVSGTDFPNESEEIRLWTRSADFLDTSKWTSPALDGQRVVHGHTPTVHQMPDISPDGRRINVDTGACFGGPLTAAVLVPGEAPTFLKAYKS